MEKFDLYQDIATRTGGDIYIGVVGPVRTGKSTFIAKFMQTMVLPTIEDANRKQRMIDELPQSADGKTIMTTQPKFVPDGGVKVRLEEGVSANVRLIDCVGYPFEGAQGFAEGEKARNVVTPWSEEEMPFAEAAELGTRKVIADHSTIGVVMTSDGSITDLPREAFEDCERRVVAEMKELGKPFVVVLNTKRAGDSETQRVRDKLSEEYGVPVVLQNVAEMTQNDIVNILRAVLLQFPLKRFEIAMPAWMQALPRTDAVIRSLLDTVAEGAKDLSKMSDYERLSHLFDDNEYISDNNACEVNFGTGTVLLTVNPKPELFYRVLSEQCGQEIENDFKLVSYIKELANAKKHYDKLKYALEEAEEFGYGVVTPSLDDMTLDNPEIVRHGSKYSVRLHAQAPSYHIMKVDVETEVKPMLGGESQNEDVLKSWLEEFGEDARGLWHTNMLGKTLVELAREGLGGKLMTLGEDARTKLRRTVTRIVNDGKGGVLCILL